MDRLEELVKEIADEYKTTENKKECIDTLEKAVDIHIKLKNAELNAEKVALEHEEKLKQIEASAAIHEKLDAREDLKLEHEHEEKMESIRANAAFQESQEIREDRKLEHEEWKDQQEIENEKAKLKNEKNSIKAETVCKIVGGTTTAVLAGIKIFELGGLVHQVISDDNDGKLYISQGWDLANRFLLKGLL